jgi:hypothetical protein
MIIFKNLIVLFKYLLNKTTSRIDYEYINNDKDDNDNPDNDEPYCYCNLCYTFRNILFIAIYPLKKFMKV